jgi:hypothetical protein
MKNNTATTPRLIAPKSAFLAVAVVMLMTLFTSSAGAQPYPQITPSFEPYYRGIYIQGAQHIQMLQIQIADMEWHINMIEYENKFRWFNAHGLRAYRSWIYNLRLQQAQMRWQLSRAIIQQAMRQGQNRIATHSSPRNIEKY